jgi:hypothetical protein
MSKSTKHLIAELQKIKDSLNNQAFTEVSAASVQATALNPNSKLSSISNEVDQLQHIQTKQLQNYLHSITPKIIEDLLQQQQQLLIDQLQQQLTAAAETFIKEKQVC